MSAKRFLVVELKDESDLGEIVTLVSNRSRRLAIVDAVPGIFDLTVAAPLPAPQKEPPMRKRIRLNQDHAIPGVHRPKLEDHIDPPDVALHVEHPSDDLDSEVNIDVMTVERNPGGFSALDKSMGDEGSCSAAEILNVTTDDAEDVKENMMRIFEQSLEEEEFMDAEEAIPRKSGRKRRSRLGGGGEYDVYSSRRKARTAEETLFCGLCNSSMTLRASYGRTRLREHVLRHLNLPTAKCGLCGFEGILREHIRRHHTLKHPDEKLDCVDMNMTEEFNNKFATLWKNCFPETPKIAARSNYKRLIEGILDTSVSSKAEEDTPAGSVSETMEALMQSLANGNHGNISDGELHEDDGEEEDVGNEIVDIKPDLAHLSAAVEDLVNESMTIHPSA